MGFKLMSAVLMLALILSGPLAPLAWAQEKTEGQMAPAGTEDPSWEFAAAMVNIVHVPGKMILCGLGAVTGVAVLLVTFGSGYGAAGRVWHEGCGGRFTVTAADVKPEEAEEDFISARADWNKADYQKTK